MTAVNAVVPGQIIVDAGTNAFTSYPSIPDGYCLEHPEIFIKGMSVEHGHEEVTASTDQFEMGEILS